jgi:hypothetical protein
LCLRSKNTSNPGSARRNKITDAASRSCALILASYHAPPGSASLRTRPRNSATGAATGRYASP